MEEDLKVRLTELFSGDRARQGEAYQVLLAATSVKVDWAYQIWDDLLGALSHKDNRLRSIAGQLLCNLARSDPRNRMLKDFATLLAVTRDERFVTARHCLLALWQVGLAGKKQKQVVIEGLAGRFADCSEEKNCTLIRHDILQGLRNLYDHDKDAAIRDRALALIETEESPKYRKKYASVCKDA